MFIVGTGRCGSTMMSNLVRLHPRLLSLSEFFTPLAGRAFTLKEADGERFWKLLTTLSPIAGEMLAKGEPMEEVLYGFGDGARFGPYDVPPILVTALPHLTRDHEALYDEMGPFLRSGGRAPLGQHYSYLFEWLCRRFDRERVVERSGSSLLFVPALARMFEGAKFVHLYRDGRDAAISMQRHPFFRLSVRFAGLFERMGLDPYRSPFLFGTSRLYPLLEAVTGRFLPVDRWLAEPPPLEALGNYWSPTIVNGAKFLDALGRGRVLRLRYEDILARPGDELARLMDFLGPEYVDPEWLAQASLIPRKPWSNWQKLPADEQHRLTEACR
ncbi:MAG: sulfotransferase family protein, partial [Dongiaceae bacterium]